jgi:dTDP-4-dehydrorhamnose reductase
MKILITGYKGQLGTDLVNEIHAKHPEDTIVGLDIGECDLTDGPKVMDFVNRSQPDAIMHLAGYTLVDKAEEEPMQCFEANAVGTSNLVCAANKLKCKFLYISTDYVFDGKKASPYLPDDKKNPLSVYGLSKAIGEESVLHLPNHFIVRTSWVFGRYGHNFIYTMLRLAELGHPVTVVDDVFGSPTYTRHLSVLLDEMIHTEKYGIYHATNENYVSWFQFARMIFEKAGFDPSLVQPIPAIMYRSQAQKPMNSRLSKDCLTEAGFHHLPTVEEALDEFMKETGTLKEKK